MGRTFAFRLAVVAAGFVFAADAQAVSISVTSNADSGADTFREAIEAANGDPTIDQIVFAEGLDPIELASTVTYSGAQALEILGGGNRIEPASGFGADLFVADGGADLVVRNLIFAGSGQQAMFVGIPDTATGVVKLTLEGVVIRDSGLHGLHVADATGSSADVSLKLIDVTILANGLAGPSDFDGVRVDETGPGDILADIRNTVATRNGGDGIELDERGPGNAKAKVLDSSFDSNGPQDPGDLEDGFDIDEIDAGDMIATFKNVSVSGNFDGGLDFNEAGDGKLIATVKALSAVGNLEDGFKTTELDAGDSKVTLSNSRVSDTANNDGTEFEQFVPGELTVKVTKTMITSNSDAGIAIDTDGAGTLTIKKSALLDNDPDIDVPGSIVIDE